ncbi:MAG: tat (twin-arginine translocation) pathway signal sequence [Candidimonas sp.]|nr:MAG: tat (twin-arginine translocation) pathway signal sequence [Candidimonas sp.]TAM22557.1 MAG: tat (twin-arginine translocation) pathway signal sequence [Candidimonas sp.]TAM75957.1 MAG: tat (twin-arginine translocation) pathway signal sequence [Candidimonas sp.]
MKSTIDTKTAPPDSKAISFQSHSRRQFLKSSVVLTGVLATGSLLATLAPSRVWALEARILDKGQSEALLSMAKRLYPHKGLPDAVYALLVKDMDVACGEAATHKLVIDGVARLNSEAGGNWVGASPERQLAVLDKMSAEPFFQKVRGQCITSLYDNQMAFKYFGYEGEVWSKGGYIHRGFDDLTWLPNPPEAASPTVKKI